MGYYTNYTLEYNALDEDTVTQIDEYIHNNEGMRYAIEEEEPTKWYGWKKDMAEMSKTFPTVLFGLRGEGEESGDIWIANFLNGKCQVREADIAFPPFDRTKKSL